jgi:hypothetical protein
MYSIQLFVIKFVSDLQQVGEPVAHFGLGQYAARFIIVAWTDGEKLTKVLDSEKDANQLIVIKHRNTTSSFNSWDQGEMYSIQLFVIKFVSDLQHVGGFFRVLQFASPIQFTIAEILLKVALNTIAYNP